MLCLLSLLFVALIVLGLATEKITGMQVYCGVCVCWLLLSWSQGELLEGIVALVIFSFIFIL